MRRLLALLLLTFFLFNTIGYYFLYQAIRSHSYLALQKRLDNDLYSREETVTIKIPAAIPYQSNTDYQRVNGSFEHQGEFFKLIKQKIANDTLYVVCYRDHAEKKISGLLADFVKASNDLPQSSKSTALKLLSNLSKDYELCSGISLHSSPGLLTRNLFPPQISFFRDHTLAIISPPPEA